MNNKVCSPWFGTVAFNFEVLKGKSLDLLRYSSKDQNNVRGGNRRKEDGILVILVEKKRLLKN